MCCPNVLVFVEASYILNYMVIFIQGWSLLHKIDGRESKAWILFLARLLLSCGCSSSQIFHASMVFFKTYL